MKAVQHGDHLPGGMLRGAENLVEIREVCRGGVRHGEVDRTRLGADGRLVGHLTRDFPTVVPGQRHVDPDGISRVRLAPRGCDPIDAQLLLQVVGFDVEVHLLQRERVVAALHGVSDREGGGHGGQRRGAVVRGGNTGDSHGRKCVLKLDLTGDPYAGGAYGALRGFDRRGDRHLDEQRR